MRSSTGVDGLPIWSLSLPFALEMYGSIIRLSHLEDEVTGQSTAAATLSSRAAVVDNDDCRRILRGVLPYI